MLERQREHNVVLQNVISPFSPPLTQTFQWVFYGLMCLLLGDCRVFIGDQELLRVLLALDIIVAPLCLKRGHSAT